MKKTLLLVFLISMLLAGASSVFAYFDRYGQDAYCNVDADGCFVHDDDGNIIYIMFWSEASRMKIMGDLTAPWTDVATFPVTGNGRLPLMPEISHKTTAALTIFVHGSGQLPETAHNKL